jgi:NADPH2:quinone reductase
MISSKVVQFHEYGDPDVLIYETKNVSKPNPNEVRIHQTFVGLNFIDIQQRKGRYLAKKLPVTPGVEGVGIIESIGQNITDFRVGDRVAYLDHFPAAYVEYRNINADRVVMLPVGISDEVAASIMLKGLTANYLLRGSYFIKSQP